MSVITAEEHFTLCAVSFSSNSRRLLSVFTFAPTEMIYVSVPFIWKAVGGLHCLARLTGGGYS